ncbi:uncharacterized protein LOC125608636 [Brassica napus]|uniref:uncharacterized protein LOC125608636 n=1 Tax=Brassica napus TaxID=3708 RepID=UPI002078BE29|nr:uncharacterized protein LOC125608636 [Brassica napus]
MGKNDLARALLFQSIPETLILQIRNLETEKEIWEAIKSRNVGAERVREAKLQTLMDDFNRLKMKETETIDEFSGKLAEMTARSTSLGENIEEPTMVKKFLVSRGRTYEERIKGDDQQEDQGNKLMYANLYSPDAQDAYGRGRGHSGRFNRGRGRGRWNNQRDWKDGRDTTRVVCYRCDKAGHYAYNCPDRLLKLQEVHENDDESTREAEELMMHDIVYLNEENVMPRKLDTHADGDNMWYLDNGASNHKSGNREYFSVLDEHVTGKVRFGDDSRIDIKGKGSVIFLSKKGKKKILANVYYITDLRSNIISLGKATESGCDVRMKDDYL